MFSSSELRQIEKSLSSQLGVSRKLYDIAEKLANLAERVERGKTDKKAAEDIVDQGYEVMEQADEIRKSVFLTKEAVERL